MLENIHLFRGQGRFEHGPWLYIVATLYLGSVTLFNKKIYAMTISSLSTICSLTGFIWIDFKKLKVITPGNSVIKSPTVFLLYSFSGSRLSSRRTVI